MPSKAWLCWSAGKDAAWALHLCRTTADVEVTGLLTVFTEPYGRVSMHGVRENIVEAQAAAAGVPLHKAFIPSACSMEQYETVMSRAVETARSEGVTGFVFGDIFLEDVRKYREEKLESAGMKAIFPLWNCKTGTLARNMLDAGLRARIACLDPKKIPRCLAGRLLDDRLLKELPDGVDPCGENGEFHTICYDGPMFNKAVEIEAGDVVERDGFVFADFMLKNRPPDGAVNL